MSRSNSRSTGTSQVRIIGGQFRGRKLSFPTIEGLRPTPDRVRETLFNWLSGRVASTRCLDLFAGSGALGFEALSRGASSVVMVEQSPMVLSYLQKNADTLGVNSQVELVNTHLFEGKLAHSTPPFDLIFLDPPFRQGWLAQSWPWLETNHYLKPGSFIYVEAESELSPLPLPAGYSLWREQKAGQVQYALVVYQP